ncbi:MAG: dihydrolipoamide acetyltransferase family protein [Ktedonobacterales bacterium]
MSQFLLPDLGEGLEEAQLVEWLVQPGERVQLNQPLCQVETAKALVDIPSPFAGTVQTLHAKPGDTVPVGAPLITIAETGAAANEALAQDAAGDGHGPVLVGYGTEGPAQTFTRRRRVGRAAEAADAADAADAATITTPAAATDAPMAALAAESEAAAAAPATSAAPEAGRASPLVRKIAQERGIDLSGIVGTGPGGRIRVEDLEAAGARSGGAAAGAAASGTQGEADEERISTVGLRKAIAARMVKAATTIPHFTEYGTFDASALVVLRDRLRTDPAYADLHVTYLPFFVRALVAAVRAYPIMNSRWDEEGNAIVIKRSIHVGIATDTPRGLLVPVIANAHTLGLREIATEANRLVALAREGKLDAKSLTGGTITITNVGASGPVDTGAPVINPPEACIVGFGALKLRPTVVGDQVVARPGAWISISCDHRVVDGANAAQFFGELVRQLEAPEGLV